MLDFYFKLSKIFRGYTRIPTAGGVIPRSISASMSFQPHFLNPGAASVLGVYVVFIIYLGCFLILFLFVLEAAYTISCMYFIQPIDKRRQALQKIEQVELELKSMLVAQQTHVTAVAGHECSDHTRCTYSKYTYGMYITQTRISSPNEDLVRK